MGQRVVLRQTHPPKKNTVLGSPPLPSPPASKARLKTSPTAQATSPSLSKSEATFQQQGRHAARARLTPGGWIYVHACVYLFGGTCCFRGPMRATGCSSFLPSSRSPFSPGSPLTRNRNRSSSLSFVSRVFHACVPQNHAGTTTSRLQVGLVRNASKNRQSCSSPEHSILLHLSSRWGVRACEERTMCVERPRAA